MTGESYENYVHVLRHSFRPSEQLADSLQGFFGSDTPYQSLSLLSSRYTLLDPVDVALSLHDEAIKRAEHEFNQELPTVPLDYQVGYRMMGEQAMRLAFLPAQFSRYIAATSHLDALPDIRREPPPESRHYLYIDLARQALVNEYQIKKRLSELRADMADPVRQRLYSVQPGRIVGRDRFMQLPIPTAS